MPIQYKNNPKKMNNNKKMMKEFRKKYHKEGYYSNFEDAQMIRKKDAMAMFDNGMPPHKVHIAYWPNFGYNSMDSE